MYFCRIYRRKKNIQRKKHTFEIINTLYQDRELSLNDLNSKVSPLESAQGKEVKIFSPNSMTQKYYQKHYQKYEHLH